MEEEFIDTYHLPSRHLDNRYWCKRGKTLTSWLWTEPGVCYALLTFSTSRNCLAKLPCLTGLILQRTGKNIIRCRDTMNRYSVGEADFFFLDQVFSWENWVFLLRSAHKRKKKEVKTCKSMQKDKLLNQFCGCPFRPTAMSYVHEKSSGVRPWKISTEKSDQIEINGPQFYTSLELSLLFHFSF